MIGIYAICNILTGDRYIGSSKEIEKRWERHKKDLQNNKHHSIHLQRAWSKYGSDYFTWEVIEYCQPEELFLNEQKLLDNGEGTYNTSKLAGGG